MCGLISSVAVLLDCDDIIKFQAIISSNIQVSASNTQVNALYTQRKCMHKQEIIVRKEYVGRRSQGSGVP